MIQYFCHLHHRPPFVCFALVRLVDFLKSEKQYSYPGLDLVDDRQLKNFAFLAVFALHSSVSQLGELEDPLIRLPSATWKEQYPESVSTERRVYEAQD